MSKMMAMLLAAVLSVAGVAAESSAATAGTAVVFPWVELIGFDCEAPDCGVGAYLARMPRPPQAVSLMLDRDTMFRIYDPVHNPEFDLPADSCAYNARSYNSERKRQSWHTSQLRRLIAELKSRGVEVYAAFFRHNEREMVEEPIGELAVKLAQFLADFGFTGLHGADGYSPPIHCLEAPERQQLANSEDRNRPQVARREAIRYAAAWREIVARLKERGLKCYLNTCWTLDPYEALFRYGVDYRLLAKTGIDGFVVESSASAGLLYGGQLPGRASKQDRSLAMLLRLKACCPETPMVLLHAVHDGNEQWSAIRHAPCAMRCEALSMGAVFYGRRRALEGYLPCLSDGLTAAEWQELFAIYDLALTPAREPFGFYYVWSDRAFDAEFDECAVSLDCSSSTVLQELLHYGASVTAAISVKDALADPSLPLLIVNPKYFPKDELEALRRRPAPVEVAGLGSGPPDYEPFELTVPAKRVFPQERFDSLLPENLIPADTLFAAAGKVTPRSLWTRTPDIRLCAYWMLNGRLAVLTRNEGDTYRDVTIDLGWEVTDALIHTQCPSSPIATTIKFRVAPHDTTVISLKDLGSTPPGAPVPPAAPKAP